MRPARSQTSPVDSLAGLYREVAELQPHIFDSQSQPLVACLFHICVLPQPDRNQNLQKCRRLVHSRCQCGERLCHRRILRRKSVKPLAHGVEICCFPQNFVGGHRRRSLLASLGRCRKLNIYLFLPRAPLRIILGATSIARMLTMEHSGKQGTGSREQGIGNRE
jgi:hypothetical protein